MMRRLAIGALLCAAALPCAAATPQDLLRAYPAALAGIDGTVLIWRDGTRMQMDDGRRTKTSAEKLRDGSILDQLSVPYPAGAPADMPPTNDPGRIRNAAFFNKMYGDCGAGEVAPKLVPIVWLPSKWGHTIRITSVNGVDRQLEAVSRELDALPASDTKYLAPPAGTYVCRKVRDTGQTSMHGWGAAIDINTAFSNYWLWQKGGAGAYVNRIPPEIVAIFERHGFIWGGRWSHFDTMHFEYRPELLQPSAPLAPALAEAAPPPHAPSNPARTLR